MSQHPQNQGIAPETAQNNYLQPNDVNIEVNLQGNQQMNLRPQRANQPASLHMTGYESMQQQHQNQMIRRSQDSLQPQMNFHPQQDLQYPAQQFGAQGPLAGHAMMAQRTNSESAVHPQMYMRPNPQLMGGPNMVFPGNMTGQQQQQFGLTLPQQVALLQQQQQLQQQMPLNMGFTPHESGFYGQSYSGGLQPPFQKKNARPHIKRSDTRNISQSQCVMFLDLYTFKINPCTQDPQNHNLKRCPFYHDYNKDRRRHLGTYQSEICPYATNAGKHGSSQHSKHSGSNRHGQDNEGSISCPHGENCDRAHNRVEEFYHPDKYKAKFCSSYLEPHKNQECEYQEFCSFAHNTAELSVELIENYEMDMDFYMFHFKTVWCPYREDDHDRKLCVYAHNWQDYRRKPSIFTYSSKMCPNWKTNNFITSYAEGCPNQYQCQYSHGWKEQEYHPDFLKVKECQHGKGCTKSHCPYYHSEHDRKTQLNAQFKYFPKSRQQSFPSNFYVSSYGNQKNLMANKQTSFSCMSTEIICNQSQLNNRKPSPSVLSNASSTGTHSANASNNRQSNKESGQTNSSLASPQLPGSKNHRKKQAKQKQSDKSILSAELNQYQTDQQIGVVSQQQTNQQLVQKHPPRGAQQRGRGGRAQLHRNSEPEVNITPHMIVQNHFAQAHSNNTSVSAQSTPPTQQAFFKAGQENRSDQRSPNKNSFLRSSGGTLGSGAISSVSANASFISASSPQQFHKHHAFASSSPNNPTSSQSHSVGVNQEFHGGQFVHPSIAENTQNMLEVSGSTQYTLVAQSQREQTVTPAGFRSFDDPYKVENRTVSWGVDQGNSNLNENVSHALFGANNFHQEQNLAHQSQLQKSQPKEQTMRQHHLLGKNEVSPCRKSQQVPLHQYAMEQYQEEIKKSGADDKNKPSHSPIYEETDSETSLENASDFNPNSKSGRRDSGNSSKNDVSKKEKSLIGKARAAIKQLSFTNKTKSKIEYGSQSPEPKSATLRKFQPMTSQDSNPSESKQPKLLPANLARQTQWEMYAIKEEDHQRTEGKTNSLSQSARPSTPVFDNPELDKNDEEGEMIYNRMQAEVKGLDSEEDQT